jgi:hypothetical protein
MNVLVDWFKKFILIDNRKFLSIGENHRNIFATGDLSIYLEKDRGVPNVIDPYSSKDI